MSNKNLQVKLVFWQSDQHKTPITDTSPATLRNSIIRLWTPRIQSWIFEGFALIPDSVNGHLQICLTIRHMELGTNDEGVENAISALCQYIFLDSSVTALDTILTNNNLIMGPFSETTMTATDRIFGRSYSFENLKQLGGFEALMQKAAQRPGPGILRNPTKWIHAPLYAGLCVTHLLTFLDYPLEMFTDHVNTQAESDDEQDQELLNIVRHIANFARVLTSMAPKARGQVQAFQETPKHKVLLTATQIEEQLAVLDSTENKSFLKKEAMNLGSGVMLLEEIVGRLAGDSGGRNPDVLETRQLCNIVTRMMCANESLHDAALIYHDSCVADKTKNATFTVGSLGVLAVTGGLLAFPPAGAAVALVSFTGFCGSLISTGIFAQNTVVSGKALHRSRNLKPVMRRIYLSLMSCRLFLLLILSRVLPCLDRGSDQYQQFRSMFGTKLDIEMDLLDEPGYLFDNVELMVNHITDAIGQLQHEIIQ